MDDEKKKKKTKEVLRKYRQWLLKIIKKTY